MVLGDPPTRSVTYKYPRTEHDRDTHNETLQFSTYYFVVLSSPVRGAPRPRGGGGGGPHDHRGRGPGEGARAMGRGRRRGAGPSVVRPPGACRGRARGGGKKEGEGEGDREGEGEGSSSGSESGDHRFQNLGHNGKREVEERKLLCGKN
jgi:hypothetical protein